MKNHKAFRMILAMGLLSGLQTLAFSDTAGIDPRDVALDKTLGGMEEGSRILSPHGDIHAGDQRIRGTAESPVGSAAVTPRPAVSATAPGLSPAATGANQGLFVHGSTSGGETGVNIGTGIETVLPGGNTGTGGGSETGIVEVGADANLETDSPNVTGDVAIDTESGGGEHSIIEADVGVDVSGGSPTVDAEVAIDPNASGGLVDAEAATSTDVIEQELTSTVGLQVDVAGNTTTAETTTVATETGSTDVSATSEVTGGVEADVEGVGAGDDIGCGANEAEGLLCPVPKL